MRCAIVFRPLAVMAALVALMLGGCATEPPRPAAGRIYWPTPPEQPRFVHEAVLRDASSVRRETETERMQRLLVGADPTGERLQKPLGVASRGGRIYVSDTEARRVMVFDAPRRKYFTFGFRFEGELRKPAGIAVDEAQNVYVADVSRRTVIVFDAFGLYQRTIGGERTFVRPTGVAASASGDRIYVVDAAGVESDAHRVVAFDRDGRQIFDIGPRGDAPGRFNLPVDAAVAPDGTLWVLDSGNFRVQAFDRDGKFLRAFGSVGSAPGQFARPRGIAVGPDGHVYVSDAVFNNVQVFTPEGVLLMAVGSQSANDAPGQFRLMAGIAVDETNRLYAVDQYFRKVEVIRRLTEDEGRRALAEAARGG